MSASEHLNTLGAAIAFEVRVEELRHPLSRGRQARAIIEVAGRYRVDETIVKKAYQRHAWIKALADQQEAMRSIGEELKRRIAGLPANLTTRLLNAPAHELLGLLRLHNVEGNAPPEFLRAVEEFLSPN